MRYRGALSLAAAAMVSLTAAAANAQSPAKGKSPAAPTKAWTLGRTPDGQPDLQGVWANNNATPLERPKELEGRERLTDAGRELAAQTAEVVFSVQQHVEQAREYYADLKSRAAKYGRSPDSIKVMPGVVPVVGRTRAEAERKFGKLQDLIHPDHGVAMLSDIVGMDLSPHPLDGPLPEVPPHNSQQGRQKMVVDTARKEGLTIRQLYKRIGGARGHRMIYGTGPEIADALEEWYRTGAADGFNVMPQVMPSGLSEFIEFVLPELRRRGLFRTEYEGRTLRENLGLKAPGNRWAEAKRSAQRKVS
mgnify:CR=1 FL=1